jgi:hypothetical protein
LFLVAAVLSHFGLTVSPAGDLLPLCPFAGDPEMAEMAREEMEALQVAIDEQGERLKFLLLPKDPLDDKNIMLEVRAGTGGEEAALWAADLIRMYQKYADSQVGWLIWAACRSLTRVAAAGAALHVMPAVIEHCPLAAAAEAVAAAAPKGFRPVLILHMPLLTCPGVEGLTNE